MSAQVLSFSRAAGTASIQIGEFIIGFARENRRLVITSTADTSANRMGPEGIWVPRDMMALARRAAYAVLTDGTSKKQRTEVGPLSRQLHLI